MKIVVGQCDLCNWQTEQKDASTTARVLAFHKSSAHGIQGAHHDKEGRRRAARERYWRIDKGLSPAEVQKRLDQYDAAHPKEDPKALHRREYQAKWRRDRKAKAQQNGSNAEPAKLSECPICGSRFFVVKGES